MKLGKNIFNTYFLLLWFMLLIMQPPLTIFVSSPVLNKNDKMWDPNSASFQACILETFKQLFQQKANYPQDNPNVDHSHLIKRCSTPKTRVTFMKDLCSDVIFFSPSWPRGWKKNRLHSRLSGDLLWFR